MFTDLSEVRRLVASGFAGARVLVVGDLMLDCHLRGEVNRISPEAPVPVIRAVTRSWSPGGAANVALNLACLGLNVEVAGFTGADDARTRLLTQLAERGIGTDAAVPAAGRATIVKTRIIGGHQQMLRIDDEDCHEIPAEERTMLLAALGAALDRRPAAVVLSDYAKGVCDRATCRFVIAAAHARGIPVLVDPKGTDFGKYTGATTITPNTAEMAAATGVPASDHAGMVAAGQSMREHLGLAFLTFTRGEHGISLLQPDGVYEVPATAREVFDVSGAGDTVIAVLAACMAANGTAFDACEAVRLANVAAGVVVGKVGTVPIHREELLGHLDHEPGLVHLGKVCGRHAAAERCRRWLAAGDDVVFTNGCFDLLHAGHVSLLEQARRAGDRLVVGLNSDASVRTLKGPTRPLNRQDDRAQVLAALAAVDLVVVFDEATPLELINALRPTILVKGADYREDQVVGGAEVKSWGGRVVLIDLLPGRSTTGTIGRMTAPEQ
jgi:D-beta-D-heptose 7-phosphate kinase/D-beta-D-heptose 1-phosphate adenosyltransferase